MNKEKLDRSLTLLVDNADYDKLVNGFIAPFELKYTPAYDVVESYVAENLNNIENAQKLFNIKYQSLFCSSELQNNPEFKIEDHNNIVNLIIYKSIYVYLFIRDHINDESWKSEIVNYIDYVTMSFGRLPGYKEYSIGLFDHINLVSKTIEDSDFNYERKTFILNYFSEIEERTEKEKDILDIIDIYNNWKKTISFDLSFFKRFKQTFDNGIILTSGNYKVNKYLELETFELLSKEEAIEILCDFTSQIIESINKDIDGYSDEDFLEFEGVEMRNFFKAKFKINGLKLPGEIDADFYYIKEMRVWFDNFNELISDLGYTIKNSHSSPEKYKKKCDSAFKYKGYASNIAKFKDLLDSLKNNGFVSTDTDLIEFRKIFNNIKPNMPIYWITNVTELVFFIKLIHDEYRLVKKVYHTKWEITHSFFVDINGCQFNRKSFTRTDKPKESTVILLQKAVKHII